MGFVVLANFISDTWFAGFEADQAWVLWLLSAAAVALLAFGADRVVSASVKLATVLGMSKVIIGATVVSLGTTTPEMFTSVTAAFEGKAGLALGNGIGSIICDTGLIFGLAACLTRLPVDQRVQKRHGRLQLLAGLLLAGTVGLLVLHHGQIDGVEIPRWVGFCFLGLMAGYMWLSVRWARQFPDLVPEEVKGVKPGTKPAGRSRGRGVLSAALNLLVLVVGLAIVILGSNLLVGSATALCHKYGVPESILAATLVAFGTSLPELVTAMASLLKGHSDLLVGNVMGADILNVLFVIGASASATPLGVDHQTVLLLLPVMVCVLVLLRIFVFTSRTRMRRWHGVVLLATYVAYIAAVVKFGLDV